MDLKQLIDERVEAERARRRLQKEERARAVTIPSFPPATGPLVNQLQNVINSTTTSDVQALPDATKVKQESSDESPSDGSPSDGSPSDGSPSDGSPSDGSPSDGLPSDGLPCTVPKLPAHITKTIDIHGKENVPAVQNPALGRTAPASATPIKFRINTPATLAPKYSGHKLAKKRKAVLGNNESSVNPMKRVKPLTDKEEQPVQQADDQTLNKGFAPAHKTCKVRKVNAASSSILLHNTSDHPQWHAKVDPQASYTLCGSLFLAFTQTLIQNVLDAFKHQDRVRLEKNLVTLADRIHSIGFYPALGLVEIKASQIMEHGGLRTIFSQETAHIFPPYLRADAQGLFSRWAMGDYEASLFRGIKSTKEMWDNGKSRISNSTVDKEYEFLKSAKGFGDRVMVIESKQYMDLINGQWFANRACAYRDGAHGELEAGIYGEKGEGAYSIVLANVGYADEDRGEIVKYCGTESKNKTPTYSTQLLLDSFDKGKPIRVLRKKSKSKFAPKEGVRYDGLYRAIGKELLDEERAMWRFELKRIEGQDPIRYQGPEARPTLQELEQLKNLLALLN